MKNPLKFYGLPVVGLFALIGLILIMLNPEVNNGGGFDLPDWLLDVAKAFGIIFLILAVIMLINTFRKENR